MTPPQKLLQMVS